MADPKSFSGHEPPAFAIADAAPTGLRLRIEKAAAPLLGRTARPHTKEWKHGGFEEGSELHRFYCGNARR